MPEVVFEVPVRLISESNQREHWRARHKRKKDQQEMVSAAWPRRARVSLPCVVTLTRVGPKRLDSDNLAGSFKHCQDFLAKLLKVDDGDVANVMWQYKQEPVGKREYRLKVRIRYGEGVIGFFRDLEAA